MALNARQKRFVEEYLIDLNATGAYRRAGYKAKGHAAEVNASKLLSNTEVAEAVRAGQIDRTQRTEITQDYVLALLREEAARKGKGSSPSARVAAAKLLGQHIGMWADRDPLEVLLAALPPAVGNLVREELARFLQSGGMYSGGGSGEPPGGGTDPVIVADEPDAGDAGGGFDAGPVAGRINPVPVEEDSGTLHKTSGEDQGGGREGSGPLFD